MSRANGQLQSSACLDDPNADPLSIVRDQVRGRWPQLADGVEHFAPELERRLSLDPRQAPRHDFLAELFLAWRCAEADELALAAFEKDFLSAVASALKQARVSPALLEEVKQRVRTRLFVAPPGHEPRIRAYSGSGSLVQWVRVVAMREAYDLVAADRRAASAGAMPHELADSEAVFEDPEVAYLSAHYGAQLKRALEVASATLAQQDRILLRFHLVDGLGIDALATLLDIHRSSVARRILRAKKQLTSETKRILAENLGLSRLELDSVFRLLSSQLHLSMSRILSA